MLILFLMSNRKDKNLLRRPRLSTVNTLEILPSSVEVKLTKMLMLMLLFDYLFLLINEKGISNNMLRRCTILLLNSKINSTFSPPVLECREILLFNSGDIKITSVLDKQ